MATLNENTHAGVPAYEQYIADNKINYKFLKLHIDKKVPGDVPIYNDLGDIVKYLRKNDSIGQLSSIDLYGINNIPKPNPRDKKFDQYKHFLKTDLGYVSLFYVSKPVVRKDSMETERNIITILDKFFKSHGPVRLYVDDNNYFDNIIGAKNVHGTPAADFIIYSNKEKIYITHKKGRTAKDFAQLAGLSDKSGMRNREVNDFLMAVVDYAKGKKLDRMLYRHVQSTEVANKAVFGPKYGKIYGVDNCHMIAQGKPIITNYRDGVKLDWSGHMVYNDGQDIGFFFNDKDYRLVFGAFNSAGMHIIMGGKKLQPNVRTGVYTYAKMVSSRSLLI